MDELVSREIEMKWKVDNTLEVFDDIRKIVREFANKSDHPERIANARVIAAVEKIARSDRRLAATIDQWDANEWLLNTPGGTVELLTGAMRPAHREDFITKETAVEPGGECPLWLKFLDQVTANNKELQRFLQRMAGYSLTGSVREHALFFLYGTGANGKGVFINTITSILADYTATAPMETFVETHGERHPTDLAGFRGARLVTAQETERNRRWAESKIKMLTGGDRISARFMRQDFFTYQPAFKLIIAGNHKPGLSGVDEAIRRRFHLVPFTVTIPENKRDTQFADKLRPEWPGILLWMIEGCSQWLADGLNPPAAVREATAAYLSEEDAFGQWIEECCVTGSKRFGIGVKLWSSWKPWADVHNVPAGNRTTFAESMKEHGHDPDKSQGVRGYSGIELKSSDDDRDDYR
jgi:putative DNA primase/helicase